MFRAKFAASEEGETDASKSMSPAGRVGKRPGETREGVQNEKD